MPVKEETVPDQARRTGWRSAVGHLAGRSLVARRIGYALAALVALVACRPMRPPPLPTQAPSRVPSFTPTAVLTVPTASPTPAPSSTLAATPTVAPTSSPTPTSLPTRAVIDGRDFDWSPDGQAVIMTGLAEPRHIWIARAPDFAAQPLIDQAGHHPRWSPDGRYIAFVGPREKDGVETVWLIHADGLSLRNLLPGDKAVRATSSAKSIERWLDGHTVVFADNCGTGCRRPAALDIDTGEVEVYPIGGQRYHWRVEGDAYVSVAEGGVPEISLWQQADRGAWQETSLPHPAEFYSWAPDGRAFLFSHWPWAQGQGAPYAVTSHVPILALWDVAHGQARNLVAGGYQGAWSPDGERIAFFLLGDPVYDAGGHTAHTDLVPGQPFALSLAIWDVPLAKIVSIIPILDRFDPSAYEEVGVGAGFRARQPLWSPDGRWLAYWEAGYDQQAWYDDAGGDLWLVDRDGARRQRLTEDRGVTRALWSPDGVRLAYVAQQQLHVVTTPSLDAHAAQPEQVIRPIVPAGCIVRDADSLPYFNVRDGYCLRYPAGFRVGEVFSGVANIYGHPRSPGPEPLMSGLVIMVEDLAEEETLAEVADDFVREQQRVGWLHPVCTRTLTVLGGQSAVLLEGPGEYTTKHIFLTVHDGKRYTLSLWPDADQFPLVAEDVHALWQTAPVSFSFLPGDFPKPEPPAGEDPDITPALPPQGTLRVWKTPRLVFQRTDHSLWATTLDGGDPWPLTGPLPGETDAMQWSLSPDGRWIAVVQGTSFRREGQLPGGMLTLIDLAMGKQHIILRSLLPPNDGWRSLPDDADRAVLWENEPAWSPDGAQFAFLSAHEGSADLYTYALASGEIRRIAAGDPNAAWPRWSPDERYILYNTVRYFSIGGPLSGTKLWRLSMDGDGKPGQLTPQDKEYDRFVAWVSENRILTVSSPMSGPEDLTLVDLASGERIPLVEGELAGYAWSGAAGLCAVSPGEGNEALLQGLYLIDPKHPASPVKVADRTVLWPRWSPAGRYLVYPTNDDCALQDREQGTTRLVRGDWCGGVWSPYDHYLAYVDTSLKLVTVATGKTEEVARHRARNVRWSPDGEWVTWLRKMQDGRYDLYALRPGAGRPFRAATDLPVQHWLSLGWVPRFPVDPAAGLSVTMTTHTPVDIPVDAARDGATEALAFREGLFFRVPLKGGAVQRVPLDCWLDRQTPEASLLMVEYFYKSLRFSPDRRWVAVENDNHAPCLLDLQTLEGRSLPGEIRISWSPERRQFAYVERDRSPDKPTPPQGTLYIHDAYQDARYPLWVQEGLYDVLWSPDGARVVTWAFGDGEGTSFWVLDLQGAVHLSGTYAYSIHVPPLFWSADGGRLAVSQMKPETDWFEWEILALDGSTSERVDWGEVLSSPDWLPNREREARIAPSNAGTFIAQAMPPPRSKDVGWWREPSTLAIVDAASGETVRAWEIGGFVPTVRWSAGDGWLVFSVLHIEDRVEGCELGPCGIRSSIWRMRVDGMGEPEMVAGDGFLAETISANQTGHAVSPLFITGAAAGQS
jgi:Tol biopolymer transport system component